MKKITKKVVYSIISYILLFFVTFIVVAMLKGTENNEEDIITDQQMDELEKAAEKEMTRLDNEIKKTRKKIEYLDNIELVSADNKIIDDYGGSTGAKKVGFKAVVKNANDESVIVSLRAVVFSSDGFKLDWFDLGFNTIPANSRETVSDWFMITQDVWEESSKMKMKMEIISRREQ